MSVNKNRVLSVVLVLVVCFAILTGIMLGMGLALTINLKNQENFTEFNPALPTRILDVRGDLITEFASEEKREIITLDELPPHMIQALLTREDNNFYNHNGYSIRAIMRAVFGRLTGRNLGGGSTITQQVAGTLYLDRSEMSYIRKLRELWWAVQLERRYSKNEILELYMNKMYFGGGTYGVNAASKFYFGHPAAEITPAEAAILVIQLSNPAFFNPFQHPNRAMDRQQEVLRQMVAHGYLTREEADESFNEYWAGFDYTRTAASAWLTRDDKARWFSEYVRRQLETMMYGTMDIYSGGYTVHTTLDLRHQAAADEIMAQALETANRRFRASSSARFTQGDSYSKISELIALTFDLPQLAVSAERIGIRSRSQYNNQVNQIVDVMSLIFGLDSLKVAANRANAAVQAAQTRTTVEGTLISLENDTGYITALVGGSRFEQSNQTIRAIQGSVQPGSTFKPLYYSAAIDSRKFTATSVINDTPVVFFNEDRVPYTPNNFKGEWKGTVLLWEALAQSMNVPSLRIMDSIGFDATINRSAALLGFTNRQQIERVFPRVYSLGLGVISVAPIQMARAFAIFGNQGREVTPIAIRSVEDRHGKTVIDPEKDLRLEQKRKGAAIQVISPQNAFIMTELLRSTISTGTLGWASGYERKFTFKDASGKSFVLPAAGKTGTTQNWVDAWTVGYTPYFTAALWFGFDRRGLSLGLDNTGATLAGPAWADYMNLIHQGMPFRDFVRPQTGLVTATVCRRSGLLPTADCNEGTITMSFLEGTQPTRYCDFHENNLELRRVVVERLQREGFSAGQTPIVINDAPLFVDPSIFDDPQPRSTVRRTTQPAPTPLSQPGQNQPPVPSPSPLPANQPEDTSAPQDSQSPADETVSDPSGEETVPAFNPLLE